MEQLPTDDDLAAPSVQPFRARATEADLDDLRARSPDAGGHFPSLEVPEYFVKDLQEGLGAVLDADKISIT
ncbi:hypothetical protein [Nocardia sp. NPDC004415]